MPYVYDHPGTPPRLVLTAPEQAQLCIPVPLDLYLACLALAQREPATLIALALEGLWGLVPPAEGAA